MRAALLCSSFVADATRVFCCGGTDPDGRTSQSIDVLDFLVLGSDSDKNLHENKYSAAMPARWSLFATMSSRRTCCASVISRGKLYVLGGIHASTRVFIDTIEAFDLATHLPCNAHSGEHGALGASAARPALPKMPLPRHSHAAVSVGAYIYVLGGADYDDDRTDTFVVYDTETDTWADLPRMHHARSDFSAVEYGGCIYVCGGGDADAPCERYCIETRSWSRVDLGASARPHASFVLAL
jgi:N-acetylneuraminic acid mutarotase